jgi:hypothetical protein
MSLYPKISSIQKNAPIPSTVIQSILIPDCQSNITGATGLFTGIENMTFNDVETTFGANQQATRAIKMALSAIKNSIIKPSLNVYVKADNSSGIAAVRNIVVTGTATKTATYKLTIGSNASSLAINIFFNVASSDANTVIATAIQTAINANVNSPFVATVSTGTVILTAVNKGTCANDYFIDLSTVIGGGFTVVDSSVTVGSVDPDWTDIVSNVIFENTKFGYIAVNSTHIALISTLETSLKTRSDNVLQFNNKPLSGVLFIGNSVDPTLANIQALDSGSYYKRLSGLNLCPVFNKTITTSSLYNGRYIFSPNHEIAIGVASLLALSTTTNSSVTNILVNEDTGKPANASVPTHETIADIIGSPINSTYALKYQWSASEITTMEQYHFGMVPYNMQNTIIGNLYTLSNEAFYVPVEQRLQSYIFNELCIDKVGTLLKQKYFNDNSSSSSSVSIIDIEALLSTIYKACGTTTEDPDYLNYFAGLVRNGDASVRLFEDKTNVQYRVIQDGGVMKGQITFTLFATFTTGIQYVSMVQINNLLV